MQFAGGAQDNGIMLLDEFEPVHRSVEPGNDLRIMLTITDLPATWQCMLGRSQVRIEEKTVEFLPFFDDLQRLVFIDYSSNVNLKAACDKIEQVLDKYDIHIKHMSPEAKRCIESCGFSTMDQLHHVGEDLYKRTDMCYVVNRSLEGNCTLDEDILHIVSLIYYSLQTQCFQTEKCVYRGMCVEWDPALNAGSMFVSHRFMSASFDPSTALIWMASPSNINRNSIGEGVFMVIQSETGLYEDHGDDYFGEEAEVIFLPDTCFEVLDVHKGVNAADYVRQLPRIRSLNLNFEHVTVVVCKEISAEDFKQCKNDTEYIGFDHLNGTY
jgi:hypothetical protein